MTADARGELIKINNDIDKINTDINEMKTKIDAISSQLTKKQRDAILDILRNSPL